MDSDALAFPTAVEGSRSVLLSDPHPGRYFSIPLAKLSTYMKSRGYRTAYHGGPPKRMGSYDYIFISTLFTFHWRDYVAAVNEYKKLYPEAKILIGGAYASLFPDQVARHTGVRPIVGNIPAIDECKPDLDLIREHSTPEEAHIFTTKGCPRGCEFCGSAIMEDKPYIIKSWESHIPPKVRFCTIHDNNILAHGDDHFTNVISHLSENKIKHMFDNGFDCRLFESHHARILSKAPFREIRFAFDTMEEDGHLQNAIKLCVENGIKAHKIKVFVLYNFKDNLQDAVYRAKEVSLLGATPWAMRYTPLIWGNDSSRYIGEGWNNSELIMFNRYVNKYGFIRKMYFEEFKSKYYNKVKKKPSVIRASGVINLNNEAMGAPDPESIFNDPKLINRIIDDDGTK